MDATARRRRTGGTRPDGEPIGGSRRLRDLRDELARMGDPVALTIRHRREVAAVPEEGDCQAGQRGDVGWPVPGANPHWENAALTAYQEAHFGKTLLFTDHTDWTPAAWCTAFAPADRGSRLRRGGEVHPTPARGNRRSADPPGQTRSGSGAAVQEFQKAPRCRLQVGALREEAAANQQNHILAIRRHHFGNAVQGHTPTRRGKGGVQ